MSSIDDVNSSLGTLQQHVESLTRLKSIVERLNDTADAATDAVQAAEHTTESSKVVIQSFEDTATRIEEADVLQQVQRLETTAQRLQEIREELQAHAEALPDALGEQLDNHRDAMTSALSSVAADIQESFEGTERKIEAAKKESRERLDNHDAEMQRILSGFRETWDSEQKARKKQLREVGEVVGDIDELLRDTQLRTRLNTIVNTATSANQAAQNGLSRMDAMDRSLSDTLDQHRRDRERHANQLSNEVGALRDQVNDLQSWTKWIFWGLLGLGILALVLTGGVVYALS